jgi:hypothetical protein
LDRSRRGAEAKRAAVYFRVGADGPDERFSAASLASPKGWLWNGIGALNVNFDGLGLAIIEVFVFAWVASLIVYRHARLDDPEVTSKG